MRMRKSIAILAAVCAVFMFAGMAMAVNRVEVKVTSEPIGYGATCDKAGGFSLEWDAGSIIMDGDQITIDLDYKNSSTYASICKLVDLEISDGGSAGDWTAAEVLAATDGPLTYVETGAAAITGVGGIYFRVYGAVGTQRITIDVIGANAGDYIQVGADVDDKLILEFLDQKSNAIDWLGAGDEIGIYVQGAVAGTYDVAATASDNTLCIDVSAWDEATVDANMDSEADKFTFIPSDPQVAHIAAASSYAFAVCQKTGVGRISCGAKGGQFGVDSCTDFDFESGNGYIGDDPATWTSNRVIIQKSTAFADVQYQVRLSILVNGVGGDNGIYWSNTAVRGSGYDTSAAACAVADPDGIGDLGAQASYTYLNGVGVTLLAANIEAPHAALCDTADAARAVTVTTNADTILAANTNDFIMINLPELNYDIDNITADDEVSVRVTLIKAPCGEVFTDDVAIGTMCAAPAVPVLDSRTIVYPYFTAMANDNWWDGLVIVNLGSSDGSFTALIYEQDGDMGAFTGTIDANGLYQNTLSNALASATLSVATGSGVLGDSLCYILVCTDFTADGFAFMGSLSTNSLMANESMGYVPRVDYYNANDSITFCNTLGIVPGSLP